MRNIILIFLLTIATSVYSCDCKFITKEAEYNSSDCVFTGSIINVHEDYIEVKIKEILKGDKSGTIKIFIDACSISPKLGELWLMYSIKREDNKHYVSQCGWSRSFTNPVTNQNVPAPPPPNYNKTEHNVSTDIIKSIAVLELRYDILELRDTKKQNDYRDIKRQVVILKWSLLSLGFLILILGLRMLYNSALRDL